MEHSGKKYRRQGGNVWGSSEEEILDEFAVYGYGEGAINYLHHFLHSYAFFTDPSQFFYDRIELDAPFPLEVLRQVFVWQVSIGILSIADPRRPLFHAATYG